MTDPQTDYTQQELETLAALRALQPDDRQLESPPPELWASIEAATREQEVVEQAGSARPRRYRWVVAASVVALLMVGVGGAVVLLDDADETVIAATELTSEGLDGAPAGLRGDARVVETSTGEWIRVDIGDLRPASGEYLEVWLIRPDVSGMVSLGTARPDGTYEFPSGLRLADFPIVDVSTEPYDGDPAHSGASLLRGTLPT